MLDRNSLKAQVAAVLATYQQAIDSATSEDDINEVFESLAKFEDALERKVREKAWAKMETLDSDDC